MKLMHDLEISLVDFKRHLTLSDSRTDGSALLDVEAEGLLDADARDDLAFGIVSAGEYDPKGKRLSKV